MADPSNTDSSQCTYTSDESDNQFYEAASNLITVTPPSQPGDRGKEEEDCFSDASDASFLSSVSNIEHCEVGDSLDRGPDSEAGISTSRDDEHWHLSSTLAANKDAINDVANCNVTADPVLYVEPEEAKEAVSRAADLTAAGSYVSMEASLLSHETKNKSDDIQNCNTLEDEPASGDSAGSKNSYSEKNRAFSSELNPRNIDPIAPTLQDSSNRLQSEVDNNQRRTSPSPPESCPITHDDLNTAHGIFETIATSASEPADPDPVQPADSAEPVEEGMRIVDRDAECNSDVEEEEELDICCLDSVKAKDEEWELKVKDRDTDLAEEEIASATSLALTEKREGNVLFTAAEHRKAIQRYNAGLQQCPLVAGQDRAMLYHNRAVAYSKMECPKLAVHSLSRALEHDPRYLKAVVRRAGLHEELDNLDDALQDYRTVLELDPRHQGASKAVQRLPPLIEEKNEKLKEEMMGKLKDLGNLFLRPFGLSTSNFQMQQDPTSGGYNIKFNQAPN